MFIEIHTCKNSFIHGLLGCKQEKLKNAGAIYIITKFQFLYFYLDNQTEHLGLHLFCFSVSSFFHQFANLPSSISVVDVCILID